MRTQRPFVALALVSLFVSCMSIQAGTKPTSSTYPFLTYEIDVPSGGSWGVEEIDQKKESISFATASYAIMAGGVTASTHLGVTKMPIPPERVMQSEEEIVNAFCEGGEKGLAQEGGSHGFETKPAVRGVAEINGKKYYTMLFTGGVGNWFVGGKGYQTHVYLWFPPDYATRHAFYAFLLSTSSVKGSIYSESANLKLLISFLGGFRYLASAP